MSEEHTGDAPGSGPGEQQQKDRSSPPQEGLYDLIVPPGVPRKIIVEIAKKFEVELVVRREKLHFANMDGDERELLAFRGKKEVVQEAERYMVNRVREFIGEDDPRGSG
jgi:hypothetical protein